MIRNFEKYTHEMTLSERTVVIPWLIKILILAVGKKNAVIGKDLVNQFNDAQENLYHSWDDKIVKTEAARIRKLIHILRVSDTIPLLIASAKGYYISDEKEEIETYIGSIEDRLRAIHKIRRSLKRQLSKNREVEDGIHTKLVLE